MSRNALEFALPEGREFRYLLKYELLAVASLLILPLVPILGYIVEAVGAAAKGDDEAPEVAGLKNLTVKGLGMSLLVVLYVIGIAVVTTATSVAMPLIFGFFMWFLTSLVQYVYPAIFAEYAVSGSLRDMSIERMGSAMLTRDYLFAAFAGMGASYGAILLGGFVGSTIIGLLLFPAFLFAGTVAMAFWWGRGYRAAVQA